MTAQDGHSARAHAILSPSAADRWVCCPGSALAAEGRPRQDSQASRDGTRGHELVEAAWACGEPAEALVGQQLPSGEATAEDAHAAQIVLDEYHAWRARGFEVQIERKVQDTGVHAECWGTPDAVAVKHGEPVVVIDAKFGRKPIDPSSSQLVIYGGKIALDAGVPLVSVIAQPHTPQPVRRHTWPVSALRYQLDALREAAERAMQPDAPRNAGPWCEFCPAKEDCPALQKRALLVAQSDFGALGAAAVPPQPATLTPDQIGAVLAHADVIEAWLSAVRGRAMRLAESGTPPTGWKLVRGRQGNRKWTDEAAAAEALQAAGVTPWVKTLMSPAAAEKALKKDKRGLLDALVERAEGKPELAMLSDKRPALSGPAEDFA